MAFITHQEGHMVTGASKPRNMECVLAKLNLGV